MSPCDRCNGHGLIQVKYQQEEGYDIAACDCRAGTWWRQKGLLKAWADQQAPPPVQIGRLEEFFADLPRRAKLGEDGDEQDVATAGRTATRTRGWAKR